MPYTKASIYGVKLCSSLFHNLPEFDKNFKGE